MKSLRTNPVAWGTVIALAVLGLGYAGYRSHEGPDLSRLDALFRSLQLFALDGDFSRDDIPWQLNVARFLAPLLVVGATLLVLMAFLRDQYHRLLITLFYRQHVVVVGVTPATALVAEALRESGHRVVAVEPDATNAHLPGLRAIDVRVVLGDARQPVTLRRARADRARDVIVTSGDDAQNLEIADLLLAADRDDQGGTTTLHVAIDDPALWVELGQLTIGRAERGVVIECFNEVDRTARRLLDEAVGAAGATQLDRVRVDGDGVLTQRLLIHLVRRGLLDGHRPKVHLSTAASADLAAYLLEEPWLAEAADLGADPDAATVAFVYRSGGDSEAIARGLELVRTSSHTTVFIALKGQISDAVLQLGGGSDRVHLVSVSAEAVAAEFLHQSGLELMARARHEDYVEQERARGFTGADNASLATWDRLPESLKDSNRRFAESIGDTLRIIDGRLRPLRGALADDVVRLDPALLEDLARREHDRWMSALVGDGWTYGQDSKDAEAKTHPLLVSWDELAEPERQKDRDAIRAIPRMLARVGYEIELREPGPTVAPTLTGTPRSP